MAWNFRRRIKILPGIHLNVGKNGVSTSFGTKGAHITTGKNGTYLNTGIPGTGLYNRQKIDRGRSRNARRGTASKGGSLKLFLWILLGIVIGLIFC